MALTKSQNSKRRSGRRIAADLLENSRCECGIPAIVTKKKITKSTTKWVHYCLQCLPTEED